MNKNRIALFLSGIFVLTLVFAVVLHRNSEARTRGLASVADVVPYFEPQHEAPKKVKEELAIGCDATQEIIKQVAASSQVVRIKFSKCDQGHKGVTYKVKNLTNGYDGQIFAEKSAKSSRNPASVSASHLSTDYIQLQSGENIIELEISLNDGQKISKKIKIIRQ